MAAIKTIPCRVLAPLGQRVGGTPILFKCRLVGPGLQFLPIVICSEYVNDLSDKPRLDATINKLANDIITLGNDH